MLLIRSSKHKKNMAVGRKRVPKNPIIKGRMFPKPAVPKRSFLFDPSHQNISKTQFSMVFLLVSDVSLRVPDSWPLVHSSDLPSPGWLSGVFFEFFLVAFGCFWGSFGVLECFSGCFLVGYARVGMKLFFFEQLWLSSRNGWKSTIAAGRSGWNSSRHSSSAKRRKQKSLNRKVPIESNL